MKTFIPSFVAYLLADLLEFIKNKMDFIDVDLLFSLKMKFNMCPYYHLTLRN